MKEKISVITMFFNSVLQDNAGRSVRGETVLNFKEQEEMLKTALITHSLQSSVPTSRPRADTELRNRARFNQLAQNHQFNNGNFKNGGRKKAVRCPLVVKTDQRLHSTTSLCAMVITVKTARTHPLLLVARMVPEIWCMFATFG